VATWYVWTMDDTGAGGSDMVEAMRRVCAFLQSRGVRMTLFVVPKPNGQPMSEEWVDALREAHEAGHDLQLHGLTHEDCFEFGPPNWPATDIMPSFIEEFERRREELMPRYSLSNLRARIEEGLAIFRERLGVQPSVFRAPCGAISKPMFEALSQVGIRYHSCMYISGVGYEHLPHRSGVIAQKWISDIPHTPFRWYSGVVEVPILNEYTWRGAWQREQEFVALAKEDVSRIAQESEVAVLLTHTHGVGDNLDYAYRLMDTVIEHVRSNGLGDFATLGELAANGELEQAVRGMGPDILSV
jgi:predicted deacetylase